jgi:low affinity Fe/Cu permease
MVFLIQNTQTRDTKALQSSSQKLIVAVKGADNNIAAIEDATDQELSDAHDKIKERAKKK